MRRKGVVIKLGMVATWLGSERPWLDDVSTIGGSAARNAS